MNEKMNVLDVQLDNCTAKDAMKCIAEYMQTDEYVAEVARDRLGLVKSNETVFEEEK